MDKLSWLIPSFVDFSTEPFEVQLSSIFILLLMIIFSCFLLHSFYNYSKSKTRVKWLKKILSGIDSANIASKRVDLSKLARDESSVDGVGHLWQEFDETLIEVNQDGQLGLYNTYDSAHFFNSTTLAKGITENRLVAAVPGFLTAIGVIGTFVGLQIGLSEMNISEEVSVEEMKDGVAGVIGGAKVAFMTSVWGVMLSVIFNFVEKVLEQDIRGRIFKLQNTIDDIFPRLSPESQLQTIADNSVESRESLQGLAEQIGVKMQESMLTATQGISDALETTLNEIMAPAIDKLVNETSEGSQRALEDLVSKFLDSFGEQGSQQRAAMENASERVNQSISSMNDTMEAFVSKMDASQEASIHREQELTANIDEQIKSLTEGISEQSRVLSEFVNNQLSSLSKSFEERELKATQRSEEREHAIYAQTKAISSSTEDLVAKIDSSMQSHKESSDKILEQGRSLQSSIQTSVEASADATNSMKASSRELNSAAESMKLFSSHVRDAGNTLSGAVREAVDSTKDLASQNQESAQRMEALRSQLLEDTAKFEHVADKINSMIDTAGGTFEGLKSAQSEYLKELKRNVSELSTEMSKLLSDYAEQANTQTANHLKVWADSSTDYAVQMNNAARALNSVVDEIQDKVGS